MTQAEKVIEKNQALITLFESKGFDVKITNSHDDLKEWAVMHIYGDTLIRGYFLFQEGEMRQGL